MSAIKKRVGFSLNIAIVILAILLGIVLLQRFIPSNSTNTSLKPEIGSKISIHNYDFSLSERHLVLALNKRCRFCTESAGFYRKLVEVANEEIKMIAILPHNLEDSKGYVRELGVPKLEVRTANLKKLNITGTPTLILVNKKGDVVKTFRGKLSTSQEVEVLKLLN